ncbi:hypothetical protein BKN51_12810 [Amycolatopsis sp. BJA-103]|nr:hypothetical protein BKN51_12810 [Amycolatopsis sp. BJA-103]
MRLVLSSQRVDDDCVGQPGFLEDFSLDSGAEGLAGPNTAGGDLRASLGDTLVLEDQQLRSSLVADDVGGDADPW